MHSLLHPSCRGWPQKGDKQVLQSQLQNPTDPSQSFSTVSSHHFCNLFFFRKLVWISLLRTLIKTTPNNNIVYPKCWSGVNQCKCVSERTYSFSVDEQNQQNHTVINLLCYVIHHPLIFYLTQRFVEGISTCTNLKRHFSASSVNLNFSYMLCAQFYHKQYVILFSWCLTLRRIDSLIVQSLSFEIF